jgi:putative salt-induced outer membrane protein
MRKLLIFGLPMLLVSTTTLAQNPAPAKTRSWHGEGDLAYNKASGNSSSEALLAKLQIVYKRDRWTHTGQLEALNTSEDDVRSGESYGLKAKSDYAFAETLYGFGRFRYEENRFSGYEYQSSLTSGLGKHLIDDGTTVFDIEGGVGYRYSEEAMTGETSGKPVAIGLIRYHRKLTATTRFETDLSVESGSDNTFVESVSGLKVKINSSLSLKLAYTVKHNTDVPNDTKNSDTFTSVGLNYSF